ncbi:MAG: hypothetical protein AAF805_00765 [Planctomycetota bacterium]
MTTASKKPTGRGAPKKKAPAGKPTSSRVKKPGDLPEQQVFPEADDSDPELDRALRKYKKSKVEHGALTKELTANKQSLVGMLHDKKRKRYFSRKLSMGVELVPEGEKLQEIKGAKKKKAKRKKASAAK